MSSFGISGGNTNNNTNGMAQPQMVPVIKNKKHVHINEKAKKAIAHPHKSESFQISENKDVVKGSNSGGSGPVSELQNLILFLVIIIFFMVLIPFFFTCGICSSVIASASPSTTSFNGLVLETSQEIAGELEIVLEEFKQAISGFNGLFGEWQDIMTNAFDNWGGMVEGWGTDISEGWNSMVGDWGTTIGDWDNTW